MTDRTGFLLDTNILSELRKKRPNEGVLNFLRTAEPSALFLSVLTIGELRRGVAAKGREDADAGARLSEWVDGLEASFAEQILEVDTAAARLWGEWSSERSRPVIDTLLAATATSRGLTLVSRNLRDVEGLPVKTLNPWQD